MRLVLINQQRQTQATMISYSADYVSAGGSCQNEDAQRPHLRFVFS
jgi:hypothetical protein